MECRRSVGAKSPCNAPPSPPLGGQAAQGVSPDLGGVDFGDLGGYLLLMPAVPATKLAQELLPPGYDSPERPKRNKNRRRGHPSYNKSSKYRPAFAFEAQELRAAGATEHEIAKAFDVAPNTIRAWVMRFPAFREAMALGYAAATGRVEESLFKRAIGYEAPKTKVFLPAGATEPVYASYQEHVAPDVGAIKYWLGNRAPDLWRERQSIEHSGPDGGPIEMQARQAAISDLLAELRQAKRTDPLALDAPAGSDLL